MANLTAMGAALVEGRFLRQRLEQAAGDALSSTVEANGTVRVTRRSMVRASTGWRNCVISETASHLEQFPIVVLAKGFCQVLIIIGDEGRNTLLKHLYRAETGSLVQQPPHQDTKPAFRLV